MNTPKTASWCWISVACVVLLYGFGMTPSPAHALPCTDNEHYETVQVLSEGSPLPNALVRFYRDSAYSHLADNLMLSGVEDANVTTDATGQAMLALSAGTYFVEISAANHLTYRTAMDMPANGTCGYDTFSLTPSAAVGTIDIGRTTVTLTPSVIVADGRSTSTVTIQTLNKYGSLVGFVPVSMNSTLAGTWIIAHSTSTDASGRASFSVIGTVPGTAILTVTFGGTQTKTAVLTLISPGSTLPSSGGPVSRSVSQVVETGVPSGGNACTRAVGVHAKDADGNPLKDRIVTLRSTSAAVAVSPSQGTTDASGSAIFTLTASQDTVTIITAIADGVPLDTRPTIEFAVPVIGCGTGSPPTIPPTPPTGPQTVTPRSQIGAGSLIKLPDDGNPATQHDTTVYYVGRDGKRHPFLTFRIYFGWYADYGTVKIVTAADMATFTVGLPVPYRPGAKLVKFTSDPKVYAVAKPRVLRWVTTQDIAASLYGPSWNASTEDMFDSLQYVYTFGADVTAASGYDPNAERLNTPTIDDSL